VYGEDIEKVSVRTFIEESDKDELWTKGNRKITGDESAEEEWPGKKRENQRSGNGRRHMD